MCRTFIRLVIHDNRAPLQAIDVLDSRSYLREPMGGGSLGGGGVCGGLKSAIIAIESHNRLHQLIRSK